MSEVDPFAPLEQRLDRLAGHLEPGELRKLTRDVAGGLRTSNAKRLRANVQPPDGEAMTPRKPRLRSKRLREGGEADRKTVRQQRMFQRAAAPRYLRKISSAGEAKVGFVGAMARIMNVHHYGQEDSVTREPDSPRVKYAERHVVGFDAEDRERILTQVAEHVAGK